jgi:hypothetical protein
MITRARGMGRGRVRIPLQLLKRRLRGMGQDDAGDETSISIPSFGGDENAGTVDLSSLPLTTTSTSIGLPSTISAPSTTLSTTSPSALSTLTQSLQALAAGAGAGANIYRSLQNPALVPGTTAVYNPATGTYYNPTTGQVVTPSGQTTFGAMPFGTIDPTVLMMGGLLIGGVLLISMLGRGR